MKQSTFREAISAAVASFFVTLILTLLVLFSHFMNVFGYLNPGFSFSAFPSSTDASFDRALTFLKDVPFSNHDGLEKWTSPILLRFEGSYRKRDIEALNKIIADFNTIPGFPGIQLVDSGENVLLSYIKRAEFPAFKSKYNASSNYTSFCKHYGSGGAITSAGVVIYCDGLQGYRNSTVLHELTHLVGFYNHTSFRDSILNEKGPVPSLSSTDLLAFRMIYNPAIKPLSTYETIVNYYSTADISAFQVTGVKKEPQLLRLLPFLCGAFLLLVFFPFRKEKSIGVQLIKLFSALAVCALFFFVLNAFASEALLVFFR